MASDEDEVFTGMEKLSSKNWAIWKFQMKHVLMSKELWGFVDGSEVSGTTAEARSTYQKKAWKAFSTIALSVSTSHVYLITSCEQPKEAWDILKKHFERDSLGSKLFLKKQYFRAEMEEGTSMEQHLKKMKELTDRLAAIGSPIAEEDQVVTLLGSLPSSYMTLITALETRSDAVDLAFVQQALVYEEQKLFGAMSSRTSSNGGTSAMIGKHKHRGMQSPKKLFKCYQCGEVGHFRNECPNINKSKTGSRYKSHSAKNVKEEEELSSRWCDGEGAFVTNPDGKIERWIIESGASSHQSPQKDDERFDERSRKIVVRGDVEFNENDFGQKEKLTDGKVDGKIERIDVNSLEDEKMEGESQEEENMETTSDTTTEPDHKPDRPKRIRKAPIRYDIDEYADQVTEESCQMHHFAYQIAEPVNLKEALEGEYSEKWKEAAESEYQSLLDNETWELVDLPAGRKPIGCRWVFKIKHGKMEKWKGLKVG